MPIAHRMQHRALIYAYRDAGTEGRMKSEYVLRASPDDDGAWWCTVARPTGRELTLTAQPSETADAVFTFADEVTVDGKDVISLDGRGYRVLAVLDPDVGEREIRVLAKYANLASLTLVDV